MKYAVEAWAFPSDEENNGAIDFDSPAETAEFEDIEAAKKWCWHRMEEGYQTRMWKRLFTPREGKR